MSRGRVKHRNMDVQTSATSQFAALISPWLTPLDGFLLVGAHLLNHRYGCLCRCFGQSRHPQSSVIGESE